MLNFLLIITKDKNNSFNTADFLELHKSPRLISCVTLNRLTFELCHTLTSMNPSEKMDIGLQNLVNTFNNLTISLFTPIFRTPLRKLSLYIHNFVPPSACSAICLSVCLYV